MAGIEGMVSGMVMEIGPAGREGHTVKLYQKGKELIPVWGVPVTVLERIAEGQRIVVAGEFNAYKPTTSPEGTIRMGFRFNELVQDNFAPQKKVAG